MGRHKTLIGQSETKSMSLIDHNKCIMEQDSRLKSTKTIEETYTGVPGSSCSPRNTHRHSKTFSTHKTSEFIARFFTTNVCIL